MDLQDPKVQRLLISVLLSGAVLFSFFGASYLPFSYPARSGKITAMQNDYEKVSRDLEQARLTVGNMEKVEREFQSLHRQWMIAQNLLPDENEMSDLLRKITAAGTQSGLKWVSFTPQPVIARGFYKENPVNVELEGGFHQVGSFVSAIANMGRIINVRQLSLNGVDATRQAESGFTVTATMQIVAYTIDPNAQIPVDPELADETRIGAVTQGTELPFLAASVNAPISGGQR
jgi:type IV pilus assembly protein PilO